MDEHIFTLFRQEVENKFSRLQERVDHIAETLDSIGKLREDLARLLVQHESRTLEMQTMWRKIDEQREMIDQLITYNQKNDHRISQFPEVRDSVTQWRHQLSLIVKSISLGAAGIGAILIWIYQQLTDVRELDRRMNMVERVHQLDPAAKRERDR